jgi:hypothetical protein
MFGTSGIRGPVGEDMTAGLALAVDADGRPVGRPPGTPMPAWR